MWIGVNYTFPMFYYHYFPYTNYTVLHLTYVIFIAPDKTVSLSFQGKGKECSSMKS